MFKSYSKIMYPITINGVTFYKALTDLTTSVKMQLDLINASSYFDYVKIDANDTLESIAYNYYGDSKKHYLILLANNIFDVTIDFPMSDSQLEDFVDDHYSDKNAVHHYINTQTNQIKDKNSKFITEFDIPVTNYDYEYQLNESKKIIKLIRKNLVPELEQTILRVLEAR